MEYTFSNFPPELKHSGVVQSITKQFSEIADPKSVSLHTFVSNWDPEEPQFSLGFANLRINGNEWKRVDLVANGHVLDCLVCEGGTRTFPMMENGNAIPVVGPFCVNIQGKWDSISFDVVNVHITPPLHAFATRGYQYACCRRGDYLPLNFFVERIVVKSPRPLLNISVQDHSHTQYMSPLFQEASEKENEDEKTKTPKYPFTYVLDLDRPVNFSGLDNPRLHFTTTDNTDEKVWATAVYRNIHLCNGWVVGAKYRA